MIEKKENEVYEKDYAEVFQQERNELGAAIFDHAIESGFFHAYGEAMDALPKHIIPYEKESYERLLSCCDEMAKRMGGHIRGIVSYEKWDANIYLELPFIEFSSTEERALLMEIAFRASSVTFEATDNGKVKMHLFFYYFEDEGDKDEVLEAEIEKDPRLMELLTALSQKEQ